MELEYNDELDLTTNLKNIIYEINQLRKELVNKETDEAQKYNELKIAIKQLDTDIELNNKYIQQDITSEYLKNEDNKTTWDSEKIQDRYKKDYITWKQLKKFLDLGFISEDDFLNMSKNINVGI